ncbi:MAG TPA: hypothetical protein VKM55_18285 [Candidatus Lokiarchaeia archaeon]|nr:hypothetical protein [Candidatus Lokiarchaeia archaeon]
MVVKCFLDTTFLMPIFSVSNNLNQFDNQFQDVLDLNTCIFLYSPVSIIEIKWLIIKRGKSGQDIDELERAFSRALTSLKNSDEFNLIDFVDARINDVSFDLRKRGHDDVFDTIIAASALWTSEIFVTQDEPLRKAMELYARDMQGQQDVVPVEILDWPAFYKKWLR